jgi:hypothetical protein
MPTLSARSLFRTLPAGVLALAAAVVSAQTPDAASDTRAGTIKQVQGEVRLGRDDGRAVQPGEAVRAGERIRTGKDGAASIVLKDGTVMVLGPDSTADLSQYRFDSTTQEGNLLVDLLQGSMRMVTGLLAKVNPERFKVKTPTAVVGVRGTDFIVEATPRAEPLYYYLRHHWSDDSRLRR